MKSCLVRRFLWLVGLSLVAEIGFAQQDVWLRAWVDQRPTDQTSSEQNLNGASLQWADGARFKGRSEGPWLQGVGRLELPSGFVYEGDFFQGRPHGRGKARDPAGQWYSGQWLNGLPEGFGEWQDAVGNRYLGHWKAGKRHGTGEFEWVSGSRYQGQWSDGQLGGFGRWTTSTGDHYVGDFHDGKPHGKGMIRWSDGHEYAGSFQSGEAHGEGYCVRDTKLMSCLYAEGVLTRADLLTVEPATDLTFIAVNNGDQSMTPVFLEKVFWQSFGAMLSRQIKIFTSAKLGQGLHFTVDNYQGPGRYELTSGDIYVVLSADGQKRYEVGHLDNVKGIIEVTREDAQSLIGEFTVWGVEGEADQPFSGVAFRNGQFRAEKWE